MDISLMNRGVVEVVGSRRRTVLAQSQNLSPGASELQDPLVSSREMLPPFSHIYMIILLHLVDLATRWP